MRASGTGRTVGRWAERGRNSVPGLRTRLLLAAAVFMSGILAGTVVDRGLVGGPAWHALGAEARAQFSRRVDLGTGLIAYPVEAIGTTAGTENPIRAGADAAMGYLRAGMIDS
jgi:hypothetical protein